MIVVLVINAIRAPVRLEKERDLAHDGEMALIRNIAQALKTENKKLEKALTKHPEDVCKEEEVRKWLTQLSTRESEFIQWLSHHIEADEDDLKTSGMPISICKSALNNALGNGFVKSFPTGTATGYRIAEGYKDALREVIHPRLIVP
jgi:hypothetical protein